MTRSRKLVLHAQHRHPEENNFILSIGQITMKWQKCTSVGQGLPLGKIHKHLQAVSDSVQDLV